MIYGKLNLRNLRFQMLNKFITIDAYSLYTSGGTFVIPCPRLRCDFPLNNRFSNSRKLSFNSDFNSNSDASILDLPL